MATFQLFFQSREQVVVRQGHIWRIGIKTLEAQVGQFLLGCKCQVNQEGCRAITRTPWWPSHSIFSFKVSFSCTSRDERCWQFDPLENSEWGGCGLDPKNLGEKFSGRVLHSELFGVGWATMVPLHWLLLCLGMSRYAANPLIVALSPGHSDITRFRPWSPIVTGNHLDRDKKIS